MNYILFDDPPIRESLLPLTFTRPVALMRVGILTIAEKWRRYLNTEVSFYTEYYLQDKFPPTVGEKNMFINGAVIPTADLIKEIKKLKEGYTLVQGNLIIAYKTEPTSRIQIFEEPLTVIRHPWDVFGYNGQEIRRDFDLVTKRRSSDKIKDKYTRVYNKGQIFLEKGVKMYGAILNAEHGPIYIGKDAEIGEGAVIRGPFVLGDGSYINMGGKMKEDTTIGPYCKAGGEIHNSVFFSFSNKSHDGFVGNSVLGEWCNLGAGTTTSNLKNSYGPAHVYSYPDGRFINSHRQFVGLIMGDHSKAGINCMFNTATVVGVFSNIFGAGFPGKFIPSYSWGGPEGYERYKLDKVYEVAERVMARRNQPFTDEDKQILKHIFYET